MIQKLSLEHISKSFRNKKVLHDITCDFSCGITALLGQNGAGKSTLMHIMSTLLRPDDGRVLCDGTDVQKDKREYLAKIAIQFQNQPMYKNYTAEEYLQFCGALKELPKKQTASEAAQLLKGFGLEDSRKKKIKTFSGGMRQRLALCGTFLGNPEILFLDEPSAGLDIYEREELKNLLCSMKKERMIIISTHIVSDVENIADQIVMLRGGSVYAAGTQQALTGGLENLVWELPQDVDLPPEIHVYHAGGKPLCIAEEKPHPEARRKLADLTDVYFSSLSMR